MECRFAYKLVSVTVKWPILASGVYQWKNLTVDTSGAGCILRYSSAPYHRYTTYRSTGGTTSLHVYRSSALVSFDSLFATYCGTLQDSLGNTVSVSGGRFYAVMP